MFDLRVAGILLGIGAVAAAAVWAVAEAAAAAVRFWTADGGETL